jgi:hypothetical protein
VSIDPRVDLLPLGDVSGPVSSMTAERKVAYFQEWIADADLDQLVPADVKQVYERARQLFVFGCFQYEFFSVAAQQARLALESALAARFVSHYPTGVPMVDGVGNRSVLSVGSVRTVMEALWDEKSKRRARYVEGHAHLNGSLKSLLRWAHEEGLLLGSRGRALTTDALDLRNLDAHPYEARLVHPKETALAIQDVSEVINRLWGNDTPGGRLYSPLPPRTLYAIRIGRHSRMMTPASQLPSLERRHKVRGHWYLVEAVIDEDLYDWHLDFEYTWHPTRLVWSGTTWKAAVEAWRRYLAEGRQPLEMEWRNRIFLVRRGDGRIEPCRTPDQFLQLDESERNEVGWHWMIIRADHPQDIHNLPAEWHLRQYLGGPGRVPETAMEVLGSHTSWLETEKALANL